MKVFVTGATGYVGAAVAAALKAAGHHVSGLARSDEKAKQIESAGYTAIQGSLQDTATLAEAAKNAGAVVHAAIEWGPNAGQIDRAAVEAMLNALAGSGKPFVYTSGVWVIGDTRGRMNGEVSALNPPPLVAWRPAVEELVIDSAERNIMTCVLRPGMVFGRAGGFLKGMFDSARSQGEIRIIGSGENHWTTIHIDDLADLYARAVADPQKGELFIAAGGMPQQVKKIATLVARTCGLSDDKVISVPIEEARAQMGPVADCRAMDLKAGSTKAARFFGWTVHKPSVFEEIENGSYA